MFDKKYLTLFIGKYSIEPFFVTASKEPSFEAFEALPYTLETLAETLTQICSFSRNTSRCVLSEELVYVTSFSLPQTTTVTREQIIRIAEESIPENLKDTAWDFQTLAYKTKTSEAKTIIEVAIVTSTFTQALAPAIQESGLDFEAVIPESCALASFASHLEGVSLIIEASRETALLVATESGMVLATYTSQNITPSDIANFLVFITQKKALAPRRIIFSHCDEALTTSLQSLLTTSYELLNQDIDSVVGVVFQPISGKDEDVLNIDMFPSKK